MILKICVCIPTFNNPRTIASVVDDVLTQTDFPLLIVDDGSEVSVGSLLTSPPAKSALASKRLDIIRFEKNEGKGVALRAAFNFAVKDGFTHVLALDGDGQHLVSQISPLVRAALVHPWDLIVGNRQLRGSTVPEISRFGRKFSNFWVKFQTGSAVRDSQSGMRIYPLFHVQMLHFRSRRFDFEVEILVRLMWRGVKTTEVEIEVYYPHADERVSHFNKLWDNVRISVLNSFLVVISLLRDQREPKKDAIAVGTGLFIGCTPFYGFHTVMSALASFFFRLNFTYIFIGSNISLPFFAPFVILSSIGIGARVRELLYPRFGSPELIGATSVASPSRSLGELMLWAKAHLVDWLVGSTILGLLLGVAGAGAVYLFTRRLRAKNKGKVWSGRTRGGKLGNGFLKLVLKFAGLRAGHFCLRFITPYFYIFAPTARRALNEYWRVIAPEKTWCWRQRRIVTHFYKFGQILMDRVYQSYFQKPQFQVHSSGFENIAELNQSGRSLILLGAHIGGWDLAAALMQSHEFRQDFHIVEYQAREFNFQKVRGIPQHEQVRTIDSGQGEQPIFDIHQALRSGKTVGIMGDRSMSERYVLVPFLGKLAAFDVTPFRLAAATQSALLFTFGFKGPGMSYDFFAAPSRPYRYLPDRPREVQCYEWALDFARALEFQVRKYPDQWFNFFPFFSVPPAPPEARGPGPDAADISNKHSLI